MARLQLSVLGGFQMRLDPGPRSAVPTKAQALLTYLAMPLGQAHSRDKLAALLWGDSADTLARNSLRQTLFAIRKLLNKGDRTWPLLERSNTVALDPRAVDVDVMAFERCVADGSPAALEQAVSLYQGDVLEGFALGEAAFEEWLRAERARLHELAMEAFVKLLGHQDKVGATEPAIRTALRLLALDPLQEVVHRTLMRLYARRSRRGEALRQYQLCVAALQQQLGVEPENETRQLYQQILRERKASGHPEVSTATSAPPRRASGRRSSFARPHLPRGASTLIGRQRELETLRGAMTDARGGRGQLALVVGEAGIGKTRLIEELHAEARAADMRVLIGHGYRSAQILPFGVWVEAIRESGVLESSDISASFDGAWRAELARLFPELGDPPHALSGTEDHLRLFDALTRLVTRLASHQPVLVTLDDLHCSDEMSQRLLAFLVRHTSSAPILIAATAREEDLPDAPGLRTLVDEAERVGRLVFLTLPPLSRSETAALVHGVARGGIDEADLERFAERAWAVSQGNPFVAVEVLRALQDGHITDDPARLPVPERVREIIAERLDRLTETGRELVTVAAAIGRQFDFALLHQAADLDERRVAEGLEELVRRRIVQWKGERFDLAHERLREVAWDRLLPPRRMLAHRQVARALETLYADDLQPHYAALAVHCRDGELWPKAVHYLTQLANTAARRHAPEEALTVLREARTCADKLPRDGRDRVLVDLAVREAVCLSQLGRLTESRDVLRAQQDRVERSADPALVGRFHLRLGHVWSLLDQRDRAVASLDRAIEAAAQCGDIVVEGMAHCVLAIEAVSSGSLMKGVEHSRHAISLLERGKESGWLATAYFHLGVAWYHLGEFEQAVNAAGRVAALGDELHDPHLQSYAASTAGIALGARGDWDAGIEACERAVAAASSPLDVAIARGLLGYVFVEKRDALRAIPALKYAVEALARFRYLRFQGFFATLLGEAELLGGDPVQAREMATEGLDVTTTAGYAFGVGFSQRLLGETALTTGDLSEASRRLEEALKTFTEIGARFEAARTRLQLSALAEARGDVAAGVTHAREALGVFTALGTPVYVRRACRLADSCGAQQLSCGGQKVHMADGD